MLHPIIRSYIQFFYQPAEVLAYLSKTKYDLNITKLAKTFQVCQGNMAKCIKKLEKLELLKKVPGKNNREINIILTKKGKNIGEEIIKIKEIIDDFINK